jgi:hypothetical protein
MNIFVSDTVSFKCMCVRGAVDRGPSDCPTAGVDVRNSENASPIQEERRGRVGSPSFRAD